MKASGVDGLSQGDLVEEILKGDDPLNVIPLNELDLDRDEGHVEAWIDTWWKVIDGLLWGGLPLTFLDQEGWFMIEHGAGAFVWTPLGYVSTSGTVCPGKA